MKILMPVFAAILVSVNAAGQTLSPLYQVISSNPLVTRPAVFREMQQHLNDSLANVKPGLRAGIIYKKIYEGREALLERLPRVSLQRGNSFTMNFQKDTLRIGVQQTSVRMWLQAARPDSLSLKRGSKEDRSLGLLVDSCVNQLAQAFEAGSIRESVLLQLSTALRLSELVPAGTSRGQSDTTKRLTPLVASLRAAIIKIVLDALQQQDLDDLDVAMKDSTQFNTFLVETTDAINGRVRSEVSRVLDRMEDDFVGIVDEFSRWLVAGNMGVSLSQETNSFGSGVQLLLSCSPRVRVGVYFNGNLTASDSLQPRQSLVGLQGSFETCLSVELDLMVSTYFGDKSFKNFSTYELGLGIGIPIGTKGVVLGAGGTLLKNNAAKDRPPLNDVVWSSGLYVKLPGGPSVLVGYAREGGRSAPTFQVNMPVFSSR